MTDVFSHHAHQDQATHYSQASHALEPPQLSDAMVAFAKDHAGYSNSTVRANDLAFLSNSTEWEDVFLLGLTPSSAVKLYVTAALVSTVLVHFVFGPKSQYFPVEFSYLSKPNTKSGKLFGAFLLFYGVAFSWKVTLDSQRDENFCWNGPDVFPMLISFVLVYSSLLCLFFMDVESRPKGHVVSAVVYAVFVSVIGLAFRSFERRAYVVSFFVLFSVYAAAKGLAVRTWEWNNVRAFGKGNDVLYADGGRYGDEELDAIDGFEAYYAGNDTPQRTSYIFVGGGGGKSASGSHSEAGGKRKEGCLKKAFVFAKKFAESVKKAVTVGGSLTASGSFDNPKTKFVFQLCGIIQWTALVLLSYATDAFFVE